LIRTTDLGLSVSRARRLGVLGGTFDPIHHGHIAVANAAADALSLDEVIFVPAGQPWQKQVANVSDAQDRYLMTVLATAHDLRFTVSRVDIDRAGPTYAVDTLADLQRENPGDELFFIAGADAIAGISSWHESERLKSLATFIAVTRTGHDIGSTSSEPVRGAVVVVEMPAVNVSGTHIRARVARGDALAGLVHPAVESYIARRKLYTGL
jgi:nicotinate-nucleotide adenylyltransferase